MPEYATLPDAEAMAVASLKAGGVCSGRVYSAVPKQNPVWPLAVVQRLGGVPSDRRAIDSARIQVDIWGDTKSDARLEAESARRALHSSEGDSFGSLGGFMAGVEDDMGLTYMQDELTARARYTFTVILTTVQIGLTT